MRFPLKALLACVLTMFAASMIQAAPASAKPLPLEMPQCDVPIDHSFRLSGDLSCIGPDLDALVVFGKPGITIDLNGFTVTGDGGGIGEKGIWVQEDNVTIRNGVVRRFGSGVQLSADRAKVSDIVSVDNVFGGFVLHGKKNKVSNVTAVSNELAGLTVGGDNMKVSNSRFVANEVGMRGSATKGKFTNNIVDGNAGSGIAIDGDGYSISKNQVRGNGNIGGGASPGIELLANSSKTKTSKNVIVGNGDDGYHDAGTKNSVTKNTFIANGFFGGAASGVGTGVDALNGIGEKGSKNTSIGNDASTPCVPASFCKAITGDTELPEQDPACGSPVFISIRLAEDMNCTGDGLVVGTSGITIDLAGHTISGDHDSGDSGIKNEGKDLVTIRNGVIHEFGNGVFFDDQSDDGIVSNVVSTNNELRGFALDGARHSLVESTAVANDSDGVSILTDDGLIEGNYIVNNGDGGLRNDSGDQNVFARNAVVANQDFGFRISSTNDELEDNDITSNGVTSEESGILLAGPSLGALSIENLLVANRGDGYFDDGGSNEAYDNLAYGNGFFGGIGNGAKTGIDASGGAFSEGSGNVSAGNDALDQCIPDGFCIA